MAAAGKAGEEAKAAGRKAADVRAARDEAVRDAEYARQEAAAIAAEYKAVRSIFFCCHLLSAAAVLCFSVSVDVSFQLLRIRPSSWWWCALCNRCTTT